MTGKGADQRQQVRVFTPYTAVWLDAAVAEPIRLVNLSTSGALLSAARDLKRVGAMRLVMSFADAGPTQLNARVVRGPQRRGRTSELALAFVELDPLVEHLLAETVKAHLAARMREARRAVLVIDRSSAVRRSIREALDLFGVADITEGSSSLDAVACLTHGPNRPLTSFVGVPAGSVRPEELATFIAGEYPHVHVVLLLSAGESALTAAVPEPPRVRFELLARPWTPERLASFVLPRQRGAA